MEESTHEIRPDSEELFPIGTLINFGAITEVTAKDAARGHHEGFLTVFESGAGDKVGQWHRYWTVLDVHTLHFWSKQEDAKDRRPPTSELTLFNRGQLTVRKIRRSDCARAHSFSIEGM